MTSPVDLKQLAEVGARIRLRDLAVERAQILKAFPKLGAENTPAARVMASLKPRTRKGHTMTRAQRKAVSERMRAYWAGQREQNGGRRRRRDTADGDQG